MGVDGSITPTDKYGQTVEIFDQFGVNPFEELEGLQETLMVQREQEFARRSARLQNQLRRELGLPVNMEAELGAEMGEGVGAGGQGRSGLNSFTGTQQNRVYTLTPMQA